MPQVMKQYYAFISYKRDDQKWAEWLQEKLEHYKLPTNLNGRSDLPKEIRPVFRDKSELAAGVLADEIQKALDNSKYLIVICSPHSAKSEWVNKEVQSFIDSGRTDKIIPFIIEGVPNSGNDETECFPQAIRELPAEDELLGVNINEMGRDAAAVKVVAQMFGLRFDDLWQRHEREKKRRRHMITAGITAFAIAVICVAGWIWHQNVVLKQQRWQMLESQSKLVSEMVKMNAKDDSYLARLAALEVLPKDVSNPVDRPYTAEAEMALRKSCEYNTATFICNEYFGEFNSDASLIISRYGNTLTTRDVSTGAIMTKITVDSAYLAKYSPTQKYIIAAYKDALTLLNAEDGQKLWSLNETYPYWLLFTPDEKRIVFVSDSIINVVDLESSEKIFCLTGDKYGISCMAISPDGNKIVSVSCRELIQIGYQQYESGDSDDETRYTDNTVKVWDATTGKELLSFNAHLRTINSVAFSPDGKSIVTSSYDKFIKIWNIDTGEEIQNMKWKVNSVAIEAVFSPDGKYIVSGHVSGKIKIWDVKTGDGIKSWNGHNSYLISVAISQDGLRIVSTANDATIKIWDMESNETQNMKTRVDWCVFSQDKKLIAYPNEEDVIEIYNIETEQKIKLEEREGVVNDLIFSPDGKYFAASSAIDGDGTLIIWNTETGKVEHSLVGHTDWITSIDYSKDGKHLITSAWDRKIIIWDTETGDSIKTINVIMPGYAQSVRYDHDVKTIVQTQRGSKDIYLYDVDTYELIRTLSGHQTAVGGASYSSDGKYIASTDNNKTTKIWNAKTGDVIQTVEGYFIRFSDNANKMLMYNDKYLVYDLEKGSCVYSLESINDTIVAATFTNNDQQIMTVSSNGTIRIWDFPPLQELIDSTRERFKNRPLTEEERKMYYLE